MGSLNVIWMLVLMETSVAPEAGEMLATYGGLASGFGVGVGVGTVTLASFEKPLAREPTCA